MLKLKLISIFILSILVFNSLIVLGLEVKKNNNINLNKIKDDFYFVHITDTHIVHKFFDRNENSKKRLKTVLDKVFSFEKKPSFIAITGDLTEWGGNIISGALNCQAFLSCFYIKNGQLYADDNFSIPVYTTPGNHDYCFNRNLKNYLKYIKNEEKYIINYKNISLFFINSGPNYYSELDDWFDFYGNGLYDSTIKWLNDSLNNCSFSNKIILMHHPAINKRNKNGEMTEVIARNREVFIKICENHKVELVLTGHTHDSFVYDQYEKEYCNIEINCSLYSTLYVQSDDCKQGAHYRNITISGDDIWLDISEEININ